MLTAQCRCYVLRTLEEQEERLIDLAADGTIGSAKLRDRLESATLQKGAVAEKLSRTVARLQQGADKVIAYVDLLEHPDSIYQSAAPPTFASRGAWSSRGRGTQARCVSVPVDTVAAMPPAAPTYSQLGSALRSAVASARRLGDTHGWKPAPGSPADRYRAAAGAHEIDLRSLTLVEADTSAAILLQSALAHADVVGRAISTRQPLLPYSIGRIVVEHALRALYLVDPEADSDERIVRRLDDVLYTFEEGKRLATGVKKFHPETEPVAEDLPAPLDVKSRAALFGLVIKKAKTRFGSPYVSADGRPATMKLAETYISGDLPGIGESLVRMHAASVHGLETALLRHARSDPDPHGGITMPVPDLPGAPTLAIELISIPVVLASASNALAARFGWTSSEKQYTSWSRDRTKLMQVWETAAVD